MEQMRFKSFIWPRNPQVYKESRRREGIYHKDEYDLDVFVGMGFRKCVITGSGAFFGETAYEDFRKLAELFEESSSGSLYHPDWGVRTCFFTGLEMTQEPAENCITYSFEFQVVEINGILPR